jgi:hypothetical protein
VVKAEEHFSGNVWRNNVKIENEYKPEMWDRNERAKKRAAKGCYRKGFPEVNIPDAEEGEIYDAEVREIKANIALSMKSDSAEIIHTEAEHMQALGFADDAPKPPPPAPVDAWEATKPAPVKSSIKPMTIEDAEAELSQQGQRYGEIETEDLTYRYNAMKKAKSPTPIQQAKMDAIVMIIAAREAGRPVQIPQPLEGQETLL